MKIMPNKIMKESLYKNSIFLMISSGIMAIFGFFFWIICAKLFTAHEIGLATTMISAIGLIISFSLLGLNTGLIRYLPNAENKSSKINTCLTLAGLVTIVIASVFILGIDKFSPELIFIRENMFLSFIFIFFAVVYSTNSIIESVFIALRKAQYVLIKNTIFSVIKLGLPFLTVGLGVYGIFGSYVGALACGLFVVILILIFKFDYRPRIVFHDRVIKHIGKFSFGNYLAGFIGGLPLLVLPLLITNKISPQTTAYYYMAMMIISLLFVIPSATTNALFAEGSHEHGKLDKKIKNAIKLIAVFLIPGILITIFFGQYILLAFGKEYSDAGMNLLRIMAIGGIFVSINSIYGSLFKIKNRIRGILVASIISAVTILSGSYVLIERGMGLNGIAIAYVAGQIAVSISYWLMNFKK